MSPPTDQETGGRLCFASASDISERIRIGKVSPVAVTEAYLNRIQTHNDRDAYVTVLNDDARAAAQDANRAIEAGDDLSLLHGVPIALDDLRAMKHGVRHTFGSKPYGDHIAPYTVVYVERLEAAGTITLGKTTVPEFGHTPISGSCLVGATASPFDSTKNVSVSSGGSAAAVAGGLATLATGTGDSVRTAASQYGVYGIAPSYGLIPIGDRSTAFRNATHHSTVGVITRTVLDAALAIDVMAGPDPRDPHSFPALDISYRAAVDHPIDNLRVAYSPALDVFPVEERVERVVADAVTAFETAGATVEEVSLDHGCSIHELSATIETTVAASVLETVEILRAASGIDPRNHPEQVSDSLLDMLAIAAETEPADIAGMETVRARLFDAVQSVFREYDLLVTPTSAVPGLSLHTNHDTGWPLALTGPFNWTGYPAASVPAGLTDEGLPVGMQLIGQQYADATVLTASAAIERTRPWHETYPR